MTPERYERIAKLFYEVAGLATEERRSVLEATCQDDHELRAEVESLLTQKTTGFLESPVLELHDAFASEAMIGRSLGPYRIERLLGGGGMGDVFLGRREEGFSQEVAIKLITGGGRAGDLVKRFRHEIQHQASLAKHPGVAGLLHAASTDEGVPYCVMEYVDGEPIDCHCDRQKLTIDERLELFQSICDVVSFAHKNLVLHRDLKPSNILASAEGAVTLLDFGIARPLNAETETEAVTDTAQPMFTAAYASPEQVRGDRLTTASDVYSLGVLLYQLLTGRRPYEAAGTPADIERVVCYTDPLPPSAVLGDDATVHEDGETRTISAGEIASRRSCTARGLRRQLTRDVETIVLKALRKEPGRRYQSVADLAQDIERFRSGYPIAARRDSWRYRAGKYVTRHRSRLATAALSLAMIVVVALFALERDRGRAREAARLADQAVRQSREGDWPGALESLEAAEQLGHLADAAFLVQKAEACFAINDVEAGERELQRALQAPGSASHVGTIKLWQAELELRASDDVETGLARVREAAQGELPPADEVYARALLATDSATKTVELLKTTITRDPFHQRARQQLTYAYILAGRAEDAEYLLAESTGLFPDDQVLLILRQFLLALNVSDTPPAAEGTAARLASGAREWVDAFTGMLGRYGVQRETTGSEGDADASEREPTDAGLPRDVKEWADAVAELIRRFRQQGQRPESEPYKFMDSVLLAIKPNIDRVKRAATSLETHHREQFAPVPPPAYRVSLQKTAAAIDCVLARDLKGAAEHLEEVPGDFPLGSVDYMRAIILTILVSRDSPGDGMNTQDKRLPLAQSLYARAVGSTSLASTRRHALFGSVMLMGLFAATGDELARAEYRPRVIPELRRFLLDVESVSATEAGQLLVVAINHEEYDLARVLVGVTSGDSRESLLEQINLYRRTENLARAVRLLQKLLQNYGSDDELENLRDELRRAFASQQDQILKQLDAATDQPPVPSEE